MRRIGNTTWMFGAALCAFGLLTLPALAQEEDHLVGYTAKDDYKVVPPANPYTLNSPYGSETCELKKVKFFLTQSDKNGGDDPRGGPAGNFVCYKAKCSGVAPAPDVDSQFGLHGIISKKAKLVCLPVEDTALPPCEATTGGYCWFLGIIGESCDTVCSNNGRTYDLATESYAGSGGTNQQCEDVLVDLGLSLSGSVNQYDCTTSALPPFAPAYPQPGLGCYYIIPLLSEGGRCIAPTTTSLAADTESAPILQRACACT